MFLLIFFFKQKTAYEMRISDWSSDVCSSDLPAVGVHAQQIMRASREHPETADGFGWTYNHQPMLAYWNDAFWVEYLSDPVSEQIGRASCRARVCQYV